MRNLCCGDRYPEGSYEEGCQQRSFAIGEITCKVCSQPPKHCRDPSEVYLEICPSFPFSSFSQLPAHPMDRPMPDPLFLNIRWIASTSSAGIVTPSTCSDPSTFFFFFFFFFSIVLGATYHAEYQVSINSIRLQSDVRNSNIEHSGTWWERRKDGSCMIVATIDRRFY